MGHIVAFSSAQEIDQIIEERVRTKMRSYPLTYAQALAAVAKEEPSLFMTRRRTMLQPGATIYFDFQNGELVNPSVLQNGVMVKLDPALDTGTYTPLAGPALIVEELQQRVRDRIAASEGAMSFGDGLKAVARDYPELARAYANAIR